MTDIFSARIREALEQGYRPARWPNWASYASAACNVVLALALIFMVAR